MKKISLYFFFISILFPCFSINNSGIKIQETKRGSLYNNRETEFKFEKSDFYVKLSDNYQKLFIKYESNNDFKEFSLNCDSYVELLCIRKVNDNLYWFSAESLGFEQYFIWNLLSDKVYEPFCDMKNKVEINLIDYKNQVLFGDTWNSDKGIMPNQTVELYLFSTAKQQHYKIAEKKGEVFTVKLLDGCKIEYTDQNNNLIKYDYSEWVQPTVLYTASSFLIEGKTIYSPENLSTENGLPWASANGFGVNDIINISSENIKKIIFINGYVSEEKMYLYEQNSRVKKVLIKNESTGKSITLDIKDIMDKQEFDISSICIFGNQTIDIVIKEIYPGSKYKDLCIQAILLE